MRKTPAAARRMEIRRLLKGRRIGGQDELIKLLARRGYRVTQTTVSRDLAALGVVKHSDEAGEFYASSPGGPADPGLARAVGEFVVSIDASLNLAVLRTTPGSAGTVAAALDASRHPEVLGTVAGDDTVLIVTSRPDGGAREVARLRRAVAGA